MTKTLCLFFILAIIAQICAIPANTDTVKGVKDDLSTAGDEAKKDVTKLAEKATKPEHAKDNAGSHKEGHGGQHSDENGGHQQDSGEDGEHHNDGNAGQASEGNAGAESRKHGGGKKEAAVFDPITKAVKNTQKVTKNLAQEGVKLVEDILGLFKL